MRTTKPTEVSVRQSIAQRIAATLADGDYVNLGIGIPTLVADCIPPDRDVVLHSENGILGMVGAKRDAAPDPELIDAGKRPVALVAGGSFFDQALSFSMIRGGHIDVAVLGAYEVSAAGDLASWSTGVDQIAGVGGAMDLAVGAKKVVVAMIHRTNEGRDKLVRECRLPLTAAGVVSLVYTDLGIFRPAGEGFEVVELMPGIDESDVLSGLDTDATYLF